MQQRHRQVGDQAAAPRLYSCEAIDTQDGWRLVAHRLRPARSVSAVPVVMVHGHGTGSWTFTGGHAGGLATALAEAGRDVWAVELRGSTDTTHASGSSDVRMSDKLGIDLLAVFDRVRRDTGSPVVDAVGHSMGGVLLELGALTRADWPVRRLVSIGSPLQLPKTAVPRLLRGRTAQRLTRRLGRLPLTSVTSRLVRRIQPNYMPVHFHPDHVDEATFRDFLSVGVTDVYGGELDELLRWIHRADHRELLPAGSKQHRQRLPMPTRFIVGSQDPLTTPEAVRRTWASIGSPECEYVEIGRSTGFSRDYRHLDVVVSRSAHAEVAPQVVDWLARRLDEVGLAVAA